MVWDAALFWDFFCPAVDFLVDLEVLDRFAFLGFCPFGSSDTACRVPTKEWCRLFLTFVVGGLVVWDFFVNFVV